MVAKTYALNKQCPSKGERCRTCLKRAVIALGLDWDLWQAQAKKHYDGHWIRKTLPIHREQRRERTRQLRVAALEKIGVFPLNAHCRPNKSKGCSNCLKQAVVALGEDWAKWYAKAMREFQKQRARQDRVIHPERYIERGRKWRNTYPERSIESNRKWKKANREKSRESTRKWRLAHLEEDKARERQYRKEHAEKIRAQRKAASPRFRERFRAAQARRRANKLAAPINDLTTAQWTSIKVYFKYRCVYCGKKPKRVEMDHITPLIKGGSHTVSNIVPACRKCNGKKSAGPPLIPIQPLLLCPEVTYEKAV